MIVLRGESGRWYRVLTLGLPGAGPVISIYVSHTQIPMMLPLIGNWECFTTLGEFQDLVCLASHIYGYKMMLPIQWQNWCWKLEARKSDDVSVPVMPILRLISESNLIILLRSRQRHIITNLQPSKNPFEKLTKYGKTSRGVIVLRGESGRWYRVEFWH